MIECKVCGEKFEKITNEHLREHNISMSEYAQMFNLDLVQLFTPVDKGPLREVVVNQILEEGIHDRVTNFLSDEAKSIILGSILGGSIHTHHLHKKGGFFSCEHISDHISYLRWKAYQLKDFNPVIKQRLVFEEGAHRPTLQQCMITSCAKEIKSFVNMLYNSLGLRQSAVDDHLNSLALAVWYMDAGEIRPDGTLYLRAPGFNTYDLHTIMDVLEDRDVKISQSRDGIVIADEAFFMNVIGDHLLPLFKAGFEGRSLPSVDLTKEFEFDSSHFLGGYNGKCYNYHGHRFKLQITISGEIDPLSGMVLDYVYLKQIVKDNIVELLDHKNINHVIPQMSYMPTSEVLVCWIWKILSDLFKGNTQLNRVRLYETPTSVCDYHGPVEDNEIDNLLNWREDSWKRLMEVIPDLGLLTTVEDFKE